jgi:N-acetylated-alpha-linked acidic dipeptidase
MKFLFILLHICTTCYLNGQTIIGFSESESEVQRKIEHKFKSFIKEERFRLHLSEICKEPHIAGTAANERVKDYIAGGLKSSGWHTRIYPYDVYLSMEGGLSALELVTPLRMPLNQQENIVPEDPWSDHPGLSKGWNAWSGSGDFTGEVVYVNYGRRADFQWLAKNGFSLKDKIAVARYGGNFRGYKAKFAEEAGAKGLIIYTDPSDSGYARGLTYPEGNQFTGSSIQRGSLLTLDYTGDPLTPFVPALPLDEAEVERLNPTDVPFHMIPVLPIGYDAAKEILSRMTGSAVPAGWQGGLPFTYRVDGGEDLTVRIMVDQDRSITRINNIVGMWEGVEYPDEWVILGCHYDAWTFGANDPNSGTALLMALAESLSELFRSGHAPSRSILLAHWDAEEHALIGSTEWVEQLSKELSAKAVAYINLDAAVTGKRFSSAASPGLKRLIVEATKDIPYPDTSATLYDIWNGNKSVDDPPIGSLGGGSDHVPFYMHIGIPSASLGTGGPYLYHTIYDNLHYYEKFSDPDFIMGPLMEHFCGVLTLRLANAPIIPYDVAQYFVDLSTHFEKAESSVREYAANNEFEGFLLTRKAMDELNFSLEAYTAHSTSDLSTLSPDRIKEINNRLLALEKSFIRQEGMPFSPWYRSLYASSDPFSGYASWLLPGITYEIETKSTLNLSLWDRIYADAILNLASKIRNLWE